ncbi:hypothetical protein T492DRAFT_843693 [Pavlovales sp. CCMP2436]|nr:hypothetical protein T492DRAFT_843693 [Pavlovales sp. CCMP2436]
MADHTSEAVLFRRDMRLAVGMAPLLVWRPKFQLVPYSEVLSPSEYAAFEHAFQQLDTEGSGELGRGELTIVLRSLGHEVTAGDFDRSSSKELINLHDGVVVSARVMRAETRPEPWLSALFARHDEARLVLGEAAHMDAAREPSTGALLAMADHFLPHALHLHEISLAGVRVSSALSPSL